MPAKQPIRSTDRRRQAGPPPIRQVRAGRGVQGPAWNDRRSPTKGQPVFVRSGGQV